MVNYDTAKNKLSAANFKLYTYKCKDTKIFNLFLYGLPQLVSKKLKMNSNQIDQVPNITQNEESSNTVPNENSHTFAAKCYAEALKTPHRSYHTKGNIFSIDELFEIFSRAVLDLQKCTSKMDQLTVIMQMLKYAV